MKQITKGEVWSVRPEPGVPKQQLYIEVYEQPVWNIVKLKVFHVGHTSVEKFLRFVRLWDRVNAMWEIEELPSATTLTKRNLPLDCHWDCICFEFSRKNRVEVERWMPVSQEAYDALKGGFFYSGW